MQLSLPLKMPGGSRGSVFQTVLPFGHGIRGFKNPRLLRDRPTDGAAFRQLRIKLIEGQLLA